MMQFAVIKSGSGKDVAVIAHDTESKRVVFKGAADSDLCKAFSVAYDHAVVVPIVDKSGAVLRRKVIPSQDEYLRALLSNCVHYPYEVRTVQPIEGAQRLDAAADRIAKDLLEV